MRLHLLFAVALAGPVVAAVGDEHGAEDPGAERAARLLAADQGLTPFVLPWDDGAPGPTDMRLLDSAPAGSRGQVVATADGDLADGSGQIRFVGVNLCFAAAVPEPAIAPRIATRMAKFGINLVRFHHIDNGKALLPQPGGVPDPVALDRLCLLIAELKKNGIYSNLNLLVSRPFTAEDGAGPLHLVKGKLQHLVGMWHEPAFALQAEYAQRLLGHRNPHTGLTLAEDPAVAFVEILNENGLANTWFSSERTAECGSLEHLPEALRTPLEQRWQDHLARLPGGPEAALSAWGDACKDLRGEHGVALVPQTGFRQRPLACREAWLDFLRQVEAGYYQRMRRLIREELGCKALITGTTVHSSWMTVQAGLDVIDGHVYWENPRWRGRTWDYGGRDWHIENRSHVDAGPGGRLRWLAMGQVAGMPFSVTEYNHSAPNVFAGEAPLFLAAHAALQGWDAIYLFSYSHGGAWDTSMLMGLDVHQHPTKMANIPIAAALFRRGDLSPARRAIRAGMDAAQELRITAERGGTWNLATGFRIGLQGDDILRHRLEVLLGSTQTPDRPDYHRGPSITSDTGEVTWDGSDPRGATLLIDTPRTKAVLGMTCQRRFSLGDVEIIPGATIDGGATVALSLLDGGTFAEPRRALLVATARAQNTGMRWKKVERTGSAGRIDWELDDWGRAPTVIEQVPARIAFPGALEQVQVHALDERGQRATAVPVHADGPGRVAIEIGKEPTLWYEVVWHRSTPP